MIRAGTVALFCSRELHRESGDATVKADGTISVEAAIEMHSGRYRYGGGFHWEHRDSVIRLDMWWLTARVPKDVRLHLFGTTPERTIGCLVVECEAPGLIVNSIAFRRLQRNVIDFSAVRVIEYEADIEVTEGKDTLTIGVDI